MLPCASLYPSFHSVTQRSHLAIVVAESSTLTSLLQDDPKIALELSDCSSSEPHFAKGARKTTREMTFTQTSENCRLTQACLRLAVQAGIDR
jgi:hypothetical protein